MAAIEEGATPHQAFEAKRKAARLGSNHRFISRAQDIRLQVSERNKTFLLRFNQLLEDKLRTLRRKLKQANKTWRLC